MGVSGVRLSSLAAKTDATAVNRAWVWVSGLGARAESRSPIASIRLVTAPRAPCRPHGDFVQTLRAAFCEGLCDASC